MLCRLRSFLSTMEVLCALSMYFKDDDDGNDDDDDDDGNTALFIIALQC